MEVPLGRPDRGEAVFVAEAGALHQDPIAVARVLVLVRREVEEREADPLVHVREFKGGARGAVLVGVDDDLVATRERPEEF